VTDDVSLVGPTYECSARFCLVPSWKERVMTDGAASSVDFHSRDYYY